MIRADPSVLIWRPLISVHGISPCSSFPFVFWETKETDPLYTCFAVTHVPTLVDTAALNHFRICVKRVWVSSDALHSEAFVRMCE